MKNFILMTILACGLLFAFGNISAQAQITIPPGSYQQSCTEIKVYGTNLSAFCNPPGDGFKKINNFEDFFLYVYGFRPEPARIAFWNAEVSKVGNFYESIVAAETKILNSPDPNGTYPARRFMINQVYKKAMGRAASKEEIDHWLKRPETFEPLLEASREWLYSPNGVKDLTETIIRALKEKNGGTTPSKQQMTDAIFAYTAKKAVFVEK